MRRTVLSALVLASTAVLAGAVPAFADDATPSAAPSRPSTSTPPTDEAGQAPSAAPSQKTPDRGPSAVPSRGDAPAQVAVVPEGAPDTGVGPASARSGSADSVLIGTGAAALFAGGAGVFVVRRRRANEA
ncbi:sortase-dependent protein [Streptomyces sp. NPDC006645]|uniref:sortase-dependent protein n=1 Tax=unclassified Streptomyces TaxID=2593676 RepID=UPI0033A251CF